MKILLESEEDVIEFGATFRPKVFDKTEVVINATDLKAVMLYYERKISKLSKMIFVETTNLIEEWIKEAIDVKTVDEDSVNKTDIKKTVIQNVKKELDRFKAEDDLTSVNYFSYYYIGMLYKLYDLEAEEIIEKIEKDLAEIEVPVNAVEEGVVEVE